MKYVTEFCLILAGSVIGQLIARRIDRWMENRKK